MYSFYSSDLVFIGAPAYYPFALHLALRSFSGESCEQSVHSTCPCTCSCRAPQILDCSERAAERWYRRGGTM